MTDQTQPLSAKEQEAKSNAFIAYTLLALGFFTGVTFIAGGVWAYLKRKDCSGTRFDDHYSNIIKVFWVGVVGGIIGFITTPFLIGIPVLIGIYIYNIVKIVKGFSTLTSNKSYSA